MTGAGFAQLRLIPDGPLHPDDALVALIVGFVVGLAAGRRVIAGPSLASAAAVTLLVRHPGFVPEGFVERPAPALVVVCVVMASALAAGVMRMPRPAGAHSSVVAAVGGCAAVWATAPDTEPALIGGAVLVGAVPLLGRDTTRLAPAVMLVPFAAAALGTVGRPERLLLVVGAAAVAVALVRLIGLGFERGWRQRAGTPTTVAPGATSVVTTAPAPTTAP